MRTLEYTYWQDGEFFIGHLNCYPDYDTQGLSKDELIENLKDLLDDLESTDIPFVRRVEELVLA
jgi:predicted RNase H-like HicB family nuclease